MNMDRKALTGPISGMFKKFKKDPESTIWDSGEEKYSIEWL